MPSRKKHLKREDKLLQDGWFTISEDLWREPGSIPRKARLVCDVNFPKPIATLIKGRGFEIKTAQELGYEKLSDKDLLTKVLAHGYALMTMDADFWSDVKFPLHRYSSLVQIDSTSQTLTESNGFELMLVLLKSLGGARHFKWKVSASQLFVKGIGRDGKRFLYEIKAIRPFIYAREVAPI